MPILTLTTDWNSEDFYVGLFKGKLLTRYSDVNIIDITHRISSFNTSQAAFVLRNSCYSFPPETIHVIFVNSEPSEKNPFLLVKSSNQYFIGTDNGVFDLILIDEPQIIVNLCANYKSSDLYSYSAFEIFADAAYGILSGKEITSLGEVISDYNRRIPFRATIEKNIIMGKVIYIDSYMNAITNITRELFERIRMNRSFEIYVQSKHYKLTSINRFYHQSPTGELLALFNSAGLLEVAINSGNAARLLNLDLNSVVRIEFKNIV